MARREKTAAIKQAENQSPQGDSGTKDETLEALQAFVGTVPANGTVRSGFMAMTEAELTGRATEVSEDPTGGDTGSESSTGAAMAEPHEWRDFLTDTQKERYDRVTGDAGKLSDEIAAEENFLEKLQLLIDSSLKKEKEAFQKQFDTREAKLNRAKEQLAGKQKQLDTIKEGGVKKAEARTISDNNKLGKLTAAKAENKGALVTRYQIVPLTSAESEELAELEAVADEAYDRMTSGALDWAKAVTRIYDRGLYKNHPDGIAGYVYAKWGISKAHFYRQVAAVKQLDELAGLLNRKVVYLDAAGKEESVVLDKTKLPESLPQNEKQLRFLNYVAKDNPESQLRIWGRAVESAQAKGQSEIPVSLLERTADAMVADGTLSTGLDALLQKKTEAATKKRATSSPLVFNTYIERAEWRGHIFDSVSIRTADDAKLYEVHVDHEPMKGPDGNVTRYYAPDTARRALEAEAERLEPDMWSEATKPAEKPVPAPAPVSEANTTTPKAKAKAGKAKAEKLHWWVGTDKAADGSKTHKIFSTPQGEVPTEESTGHNYITGEFDTQMAAQKYIDDGFADIEQQEG